MKIINTIKNYILLVLYSVVNIGYDFIRFILYSYTAPVPRSEYEYDSFLMKEMHRIEKGLTLAKPRPYFGKDVILLILRYVNEYSEIYKNARVNKLALDAIGDYIQFHKKNKYDDEFITLIEGKLKATKLKLTVNAKGGVQTLLKKEVEKNTNIDFKKFAYARHSIRNFSHKEVNVSEIKEAIEVALKTPSVCNRQSWRAHLIKDKEQIKKVLKYQNGNKGFTDQINKAIMVTSDISSFSDSYERNQQWVDGGMFAMSIVYALHAKGLGTCCLNWCVNVHNDVLVRRQINMLPSESIIMFIAVGHIPEELTVCQSPRKEISEVLVTHK